MPRIAPVLLATLVAASPAAAAQSFTGEYAVSFLGFTVARSTFDSTFGNDTFSVKGRVASAGLAELFDSTRGTISSTGRFDGKTTQPSAFRVDYTEGAKSQTTAIRFRGGAVTKTVNVPPLKKRGNDWVPLQQSHLRSVTDPISATLVRALAKSVAARSGSMMAKCARTSGSNLSRRTRWPFRASKERPSPAASVSCPWPDTGRAAGRWNS